MSNRLAFLLVTALIGCARGQDGANLESHIPGFSAALVDGTLNVGTDCSERTPCNVRFGNFVHNIKKPAAIRVSGPNSGLVLVYLDNTGSLVAGSKVKLVCEGCLYTGGLTQFPPDSIPLFTCTVASGVFQPTGCADLRAVFSTTGIVSGVGISITDTPGRAMISLDPTLVSLHVVSPPKMSHDSCSTNQFSFDNDYYYLCIAANTWKRFALSSF
jgi:hypothetical protein